MKLHQLFENKEDLWENPTPESVADWFWANTGKIVKVSSVTIKNGRVNCNFAVEINAESFTNLRELDRLPFKLGKVREFSLYGSILSKKFITTTEGFPTFVKGNVDISRHSIEEITEFPEVGGKNITIQRGLLKSMKGLEKCGGRDKTLYLVENKIDSLDGVPRELKALILCGNNISDLSGIYKRMDYLEAFNLGDLPIKKGLLAILKIPGYTSSLPEQKVYNTGPISDDVRKGMNIITNLISRGYRDTKLFVKAHQAFIENDLDDLAEF